MRTPNSQADPITGPVPRSALSRGLWRLKHRLRSLLGSRRGFSVEGVYYKETTTELLSRALSRKGAGHKEYRVTFASGTKMLIHCSHRRPYADVMGPTVLPHMQRAQAMIRPGMRVLIIPCGTGNAVRWLAERVGPSGAVVALDPDKESITYAQRRYARPNVAFEQSDAAALAGEVDGAFDAALVVPVDPAVVTPSLLAEVWRVVAPGGWMLAACPADEVRTGMDAMARGLGEETAGVDWLSTSEDAFHVVLVRKLAPE